MRERELVYSIEALECKYNDVQSQPLPTLTVASVAAIRQAQFDIVTVTWSECSFHDA